MAAGDGPDQGTVQPFPAWGARGRDLHPLGPEALDVAILAEVKELRHGSTPENHGKSMPNELAVPFRDGQRLFCQLGSRNAPLSRGAKVNGRTIFGEARFTMGSDTADSTAIQLRINQMATILNGIRGQIDHNRPCWYVARRPPTTGSGEQTRIRESPPIRLGFVPHSYQWLTRACAAAGNRRKWKHSFLPPRSPT